MSAVRLRSPIQSKSWFNIVPSHTATSMKSSHRSTDPRLFFTRYYISIYIQGVMREWNCLPLTTVKYITAPCTQFMKNRSDFKRGTSLSNLDTFQQNLTTDIRVLNTYWILLALSQFLYINFNEQKIFKIYFIKKIDRLCFPKWYKNHYNGPLKEWKYFDHM